MNRFLTLISLSILTLQGLTPAYAADPMETTLKSSLGFLEKIPEVKWFKVRKDSVIIGWKGFPHRFPHINHEIAIKGSAATRGKIQVWSVRHNQKNWIVGTRPFLCKTTARNGRVWKSTCRF
ncbi:MAG: hypothetical protein ACE5E9_11790 [Nitrospinaceae bacterium]